MSKLAGLILAAGKGTRMRSELPKGLFPVCGMPMVEHIGRALTAAGADEIVVVVGHLGELMTQRLGEKYAFVWQREQKGTGHAVQCAEDWLRTLDCPVIITPGDVPLLNAAALSQLMEQHMSNGADATIATLHLTHPEGYGRIVRDPHGHVHEIVEEKDANPRIRSIQEVNSGVYCFEPRRLLDVLHSLKDSTAQGERYLTDCIKLIAERGGTVQSRCFEDFEMLRGVNDRWQLAEASQSWRKRRLKELCLSGVTIEDPSTTFIEADVEIGIDTVVRPMTTITAGSRIGANCQIGPNAIIDRSTVGDETSVNMSRINEAKIGNLCKIGPFAHLRPLSVVGDGCKIGNFVELKKTMLANNVSASHLSYIGDANVGAGSNIGAGTITCNYDGFDKHVTDIGERVFVGSNSTLVAPVVLEDDAFVAAGSVISKNVPSNALGVGRARQENKEGWVIQWRKRKRSETVS